MMHGLRRICPGHSRPAAFAAVCAASLILLIWSWDTPTATPNPRRDTASIQSSTPAINAVFPSATSHSAPTIRAASPFAVLSATRSASKNPGPVISSSTRRSKAPSWNDLSSLPPAPCSSSSPLTITLSAERWLSLSPGVPHPHSRESRSPLSILILGVGEMLGSAVARACLDAGWQVTGVDDLAAGFRTSVPPGAKFVELRPLTSPEGAAQLGRVVSALTSRASADNGTLGVVVLGYDVRRPDAEAALGHALRSLPPHTVPWVVGVDDGGHAMGLYGQGRTSRSSSPASAALNRSAPAASNPACARSRSPRLATASERWRAANFSQLALVSLVQMPSPVSESAPQGEDSSCDPPSRPAVVGLGMSPQSPTLRRGLLQADPRYPLTLSAVASLVDCTARAGSALDPSTHRHFDFADLLGTLLTTLSPAHVPALPLVDGALPDKCLLEDTGSRMTLAVAGACAAEWGRARDAAQETIHVEGLARAIAVIALAAAVEGRQASLLARKHWRQTLQEVRPLTQGLSNARQAACAGAPVVAIVDTATAPLLPRSRGETSQSLPQPPAGWGWDTASPRSLPPPLLPALSLPRLSSKLAPVSAACPPIMVALERLGVVARGSAAAGAAANVSVLTAPAPAVLPGTDAWVGALLDAAWWALRHGALHGYREPHPSAGDFGYAASGFSALSAGSRYVLADLSVFSVTHGKGHTQSAWTQWTYGTLLKRGGIPFFSTALDPVLPARVAMYEPSDDEVSLSGGRVSLAAYPSLALRLAVVWTQAIAEAAPLAPLWTVRLWDDSWADGAGLVRTANAAGVPDAASDAALVGLPQRRRAGAGSRSPLFVRACGGAGALWSGGALQAWRGAMPACIRSLAARMFNNTPGAPGFDAVMRDWQSHWDDVILDYCVWREGHGWGEPGSATAVPRPGAVVPRFIRAPGFNSHPFGHLNATAYLGCRSLACRRPVAHRFTQGRPEVAVTAHYVYAADLRRFTEALYGRTDAELDAYCDPGALPKGCAMETPEAAVSPEPFPEELPPNSTWMGLCG